jgi:hypothetical protein
MNTQKPTCMISILELAMTRRIRRTTIVGIAVAVSSTMLFGQAASKTIGPEQHRVIASVETMFRAAAMDDAGLFDSVTAPGFYLFDAGQRFDGNSILAVLKQLKAAGKQFEWHITEPDVNIEGATGWIAYVDKGSMIEASGSTAMEWLESAFLINRAGQWKLVFMQSTPVAHAARAK